MAKRYRLYEVQSLSEYDLSKLSKYDLQRVLAPIRDAANKRVKRIQKAKLEAPSLSALTKSGGRLSTKGKDKAGLIKEIQRGQAFLGMGTSRIGGEFGARAYTEARNKRKKESMETFGYLTTSPKYDLSAFGKNGRKDYSDMSDKAKGTYWNIMHKIKQKGIQFNEEQYNIHDALVVALSSTRNWEDAFLNSIPAEAREYVLNKSYMPNDELYHAKKKIKGGYENYKVEKVVEMIDAYTKWKVDHPEL